MRGGVLLHHTLPIPPILRALTARWADWPRPKAAERLVIGWGTRAAQ